MIALGRRKTPYIVGEIGFLVTQLLNDRGTINLRDRPPHNTSTSAEMVIGMGCVEALYADSAYARMLGGAELEDALREFGGQGLRFNTAHLAEC